MTDPINDPNFNPLLPRAANPERMAKISTLAGALKDIKRELDEQIREAKAAGHSYTQLEQASGYSRAMVQRIVAAE